MTGQNKMGTFVSLAGKMIPWILWLMQSVRDTMLTVEVWRAPNAEERGFRRKIGNTAVLPGAQ